MQRLFAAFFVLIISPLLLLTLGVVWLWDRSTPVFIQERIGLNKDPFFVYKVRTMHQNKITGIGRVLRKTGIDELPQLFNILEGEMNFVGPRPLTKADIIRLKWDDDSKEIRWSVRPGITGMAQLVNVCDASVSWNCDMQYIETRSIKTDLKILWKSLLVPFIGKQKTKQIIHKSTSS